MVIHKIHNSDGTIENIGDVQLDEKILTMDDEEEIQKLVELQYFVIDEIEKKDKIQQIWGIYSEDKIKEILNNDGVIKNYYYNGDLVGSSQLIVNDKEEFDDYGAKSIPFDKTAINGGVILKSKYWGNGLQRQMSEELEKSALEKGYKYMIGTVSPKNKWSFENLYYTGYDIIDGHDMAKGFRFLCLKDLESKKEEPPKRDFYVLIREAYEKLINNKNGENADLKEKNEKLQAMLKRTLEFAETIRNSRVGKFFFRKKIKELPEPEGVFDEVIK